MPSRYDIKQIKRGLKYRFSQKETPVAARRQLQSTKQLSTSFLYSITGKIKYSEEMSLQNFTCSKSLYIENLNITVGSNTYTWRVCEAPIPENVILGLDFLSLCVVDIK